MVNLLNKYSSEYTVYGHATLCGYLHWVYYLFLAVEKLHEGGTYLDAIVTGGTQCEMAQCNHSVGYGGR